MKHSKIDALIQTLQSELDVMIVCRTAIQAAPDVSAVDTIGRNITITEMMIDRLRGDDTPAEAPKARVPRKAKKGLPAQD